MTETRTEASADEETVALADAYERGLAHEKAGEVEAAAAAYRTCLALDPEDRGGVAVRLASLGLGEAPDRAPPAYVATLFGQHAEDFEVTLVHALGYGIPDEIAIAIEDAGLGPFGHGVDLGCGTGLVGEALDGMVEVLDGVDLAEEMLALADAKEVYADLYVGDAVAYLEGVEAGSHDLVVAADVLPYLGTLGPLLAASARALTPGGVLAVSTETLAVEAFAGRAWTVGPNQRYAHEPGALRAALDAAGFEIAVFDDATIRHESGEPVPGHLVIARRR
jgi:predicted TPR repeat methyltransferase